MNKNFNPIKSAHNSFSVRALKTWEILAVVEKPLSKAMPVPMPGVSVCHGTELEVASRTDARQVGREFHHIPNVCEVCCE